jgi:hypothetical protein
MASEKKTPIKGSDWPGPRIGTKKRKSGRKAKAKAAPARKSKRVYRRKKK